MHVFGIFCKLFPTATVRLKAERSEGPDRSARLKHILTIYVLSPNMLKDVEPHPSSCLERAVTGTTVAFQTDLSNQRPKELPMSHATETSIANEIDVRSLVPAQRHEKIFQLVDELSPGASFVLVNNHDPKPLYYQLEAEYPKQFSWAYIESGPIVWRVEIGRLPKAA